MRETTNSQISQELSRFAGGSLRDAVSDFREPRNPARRDSEIPAFRIRTGLGAVSANFRACRIRTPLPQTEPHFLTRRVRISNGQPPSHAGLALQKAPPISPTFPALAGNSRRQRHHIWLFPRFWSRFCRPVSNHIPRISALLRRPGTETGSSKQRKF